MLSFLPKTCTSQNVSLNALPSMYSRTVLSSSLDCQWDHKGPCSFYFLKTAPRQGFHFNSLWRAHFSIPVWATFNTQQVASLTPVSWTFSVKRLIRFSERKSPIVAASFHDVFGLELSKNSWLPGEWHNMAVCLWVIKWRCVFSVRSMHTSLGDILWWGKRNMSILRYLFISLKLPSLHWCSLCCPDSWKPYLK